MRRFSDVNPGQGLEVAATAEVCLGRFKPAIASAAAVVTQCAGRLPG